MIVQVANLYMHVVCNSVKNKHEHLKTKQLTKTFGYLTDK